MFDKLIESNSAEADFKPRRGYFMVSSVIMGILFLAAVVINLYAQEFDLGTKEFEMAMIIMPVVPDTPEPPEKPSQPEQTRSSLPRRQANIPRLDELSPIPKEISVTPSTQRERPDYPFQISMLPESDANRQPGNPGGTGVESGGNDPSSNIVSETPSEPPPIITKPAEARPPRVISKGPVNGYAIFLPKPVYPAPARAIGMVGDVSVQVLINEEGTVVSAKAVAGPILLKQEAERAAWKAKFKPTYLADVPVKVTGVITYRFTK